MTSSFHRKTILLVLFSFLFLSAAPLLAFAVPAGQALTLFGIDLTCSPEKAPKAGGCGFPALIALGKGLVGQLLLWIIPIASAVIIAGGIVIMTAGGSEDKVKKGKAIITTAVIGVTIAFGAWLIINAIFLALTGKSVTNF